MTEEMDIKEFAGEFLKRTTHPGTKLVIEACLESIDQLRTENEELKRKLEGLLEIFEETSHKLQLYSRDNRNRYVTELIQRAEAAEKKLEKAVECLEWLGNTRALHGSTGTIIDKIENCLKEIK